MKKILLFSILICFVFSSRYQYDTSSSSKKKKKYNKKKYTHIGWKDEDKARPKLYTMWGLGIPGHNNGYWGYKSGYNLLGFYLNNAPIPNSLHGFNTTLTNLYRINWEGFTKKTLFMAYSMIIFPDFRTADKRIEDRLYIRSDIGVTITTDNYGWEDTAELGALVGIGYKLDLNDYLNTKKDNPYIMFEITTHFRDILSTTEGFIEDFTEEPGDLFDLFEGYFLKGDWNLTVSVMADITKK